MMQQLKIEGEQFFDEYILVAPGSDYGRAMWDDIQTISNGTILDNPIIPTNKIISMLHHIHFSFVINRQIQLPFQSLWKKLYSFETIKLDASKRYCVIFTDVSASRTDCRYLKEIGERKNITLILVMVNTMARRGSLIEKRKKYFSQIYSFDRKDCEKYGFIYHPTNYSIMNLKKSVTPTIDAFFVGVSKGRAKLITQIFNRISQEDGKADFYIAGIESSAQRAKGIHYNEWLSYADILKKIQNTNCVVEVMDGTQDGVTLRTMEAICYNKKLLTNNQSIKKMDYYKSGYIQVFDTTDKIDIEFIKKREDIDYHYCGEFSPIHLLERINKEVEKRNGHAIS